MPNSIVIKNKIQKFKKKIEISGDKSISIRWVLISSLVKGVSKAKNLLMSEDVIAAINAIRKLGIKVNINKNICKVFGNGLDGYKYKKNLVINAQNSGTLGRLILGLLINTPYPIKIIGDKSLSKRDFKRVTDPLSKFGAKFVLKDEKYLPLKIYGSKNLKSIFYKESRGSAQCKSSVIFAGMRTKGETKIKAKKSRNHTELLAKHLKLPIKIKLNKNYDFIKISKVHRIKKLNYNIPSDISSSAFFIVLATLSKNSQLTIKNVNINPSRIGIISILKKMGANIKFEKQKNYKGAKIADTAADIFNDAEIIVKVKEPQKVEVDMIRENQIVYTYLHLAAAKELTEGLIKSKSINIAYETVTDDNGRLPLLAPMSAVAGRMSVQAGAHCLEKNQSGRGLLLGGAPGVTGGTVVILGGGVVGENAAVIATGMQAKVHIVDKSEARLKQLVEMFGDKIIPEQSDKTDLDKLVAEADLLVGGVLIPGAEAPKLITKEMIKTMKRGSVIVDVAIDQGGCVETSKPTTHGDPTYIVDEVVHYCVANMPGGVPRTSTLALNNATLPFLVKLANKGYQKALSEDKNFLAGLNIFKGQVTYKAVADVFGHEYIDPSSVI